MSPLYDAHNHLQDARLTPYHAAIAEAVERERIGAMVVNGSGADDWPAVAACAARWRWVVPSFGVHPWYVAEQPADWREQLIQALDRTPAAVGEIGLDRWKAGLDVAAQEEVFAWQLRLAAARGVPASLHCLQAWGRMEAMLRELPRPECGFLLHSYGGPVEMIRPLARLGAYFSLPGYFAHARKERQRETFRHVPPDRLLIETDAPDQPLPRERVRYLLPDAGGRPVTHPADLRAVYEFAAEWLGGSVEGLAAQVAENFRRLFGSVLTRREADAARVVGV